MFSTLRDILLQKSENQRFQSEKVYALLEALSSRGGLKRETARDLEADFLATGKFDGPRLVGELQQKKVLTRAIVDAAPDRRRIIFIHIPKCGGTHIRETMSKLHPVLPVSIEHPKWKDYSNENRILKSFFQSFEKFPENSIVITGHRTLKLTITLNLLREQDYAFSFFRDPMEMAVSMANYIATVLSEDRQFLRPDSKNWIQRYGIDPSAASSEAMISSNLFRHPLFLEDISNTMCKFLGAGTADSAIEMIRNHRIEMIPVESADDYLWWRWSIRPQPHRNVSKKSVSVSQLDPSIVDELRKSTLSEDYELFSYLKAHYKDYREKATPP